MYLTKSIIRNFALRESSQKSLSNVRAKGWAQNAVRVFVSHSHIDVVALSNEELLHLITMLITLASDVYIDSLDQSMPAETSAETAIRIKDKIDVCDRFLLVATENAVSSRWVPWELGYADKAKGIANIAILPIADPYGRWDGSEYLRLYPTARISSDDRLAVFRPSAQKGYYVEHWMRNGG